MMNLCEFPKETKWGLKYKATRDGFCLHQKCDGVKNTLTVITATSG